MFRNPLQEIAMRARMRQRQQGLDDREAVIPVNPEEAVPTEMDYWMFMTPTLERYLNQYMPNIQRRGIDG